MIKNEQSVDKNHEEKVFEDKLYRVVRRKDSHLNTKVNPDGLKSAIQFDENNNLAGPVEIIEVDEKEWIRPEYVEIKPMLRSWKQLILEEIVAPIAKETLEQALDIGYQHFHVWMEQTAVPKAKEKSKEIGKNIKLYFSIIKDGIMGKELMANRILKEEAERKEVRLVQQQEISVNALKPETGQTSNEKEIHTTEEIEEVVNIMRSSAITMAACIRWLNNSVKDDDGSDPKKHLEIQRNLEELSTADVMKQIDLLLEDRNKGLLDAVSLRMVAAFREGNFIIDGKTVSMSNYLKAVE